MSPLRIVIIAVLLYFGYRLIFGGRKRNKKTLKPDIGNDAPVSDVLMEDPICHSLVPKQQAIHLQHRGSMVYFCSEECYNKFIAQKKGENE